MVVAIVPYGALGSEQMLDDMPESTGDEVFSAIAHPVRRALLDDWQMVSSR